MVTLAPPARAGQSPGLSPSCLKPMCPPLGICWSQPQLSAHPPTYPGLQDQNRGQQVRCELPVQGGVGCKGAACPARRPCGFQGRSGTQECAASGLNMQLPS